MSEKLTAKQAAEQLLYKPAYAADKSADVKEKAAAFAEGYKAFLNAAKTEREAAAASEKLLLEAGYEKFEPKKTYAPGQKIYFVQEHKAVVAATIGRKSFEEGFRLVIAHIDSPRLDLRPNPLYEANHLSYFKTHYYGGIRKYQWGTMPLAIHGVFTRADGSSVSFAVGEDENDPVFCITDLLPHLGAEQNDRKLSEGIKAEELNVLIGSDAVEDADIKEAVKLNTLMLLHEKYGITEDDFTSAELPSQTFNTASNQGKPKNLVILLQESLGAQFVGSLGGLPLTPNIDALSKEGWAFEQLYATGTRSVRGIEAVLTGFTPTPAQAVVKLGKSQTNFFTIADLLKQRGYDTSFIYGGESHFDNMRSFFLGNGFTTIVEQKDFKNPVFEGSWGASDEDLMAKANETFAALHKEGKPFFSLVFSSSNHDPFEFPDNRIALYEQPKQTRNNAAKYADYAVGEFFKQEPLNNLDPDKVVALGAATQANLLAGQPIHQGFVMEDNRAPTLPRWQRHPAVKAIIYQIDDADIHIEEIQPGDMNRYRGITGWQDFTARREIIRVRDGEDRAMRRVDDRVEVFDAEHAQIADREAAALIFMGGELFGLGAGGEVLHLGGECREGFLLGVLDDIPLFKMPDEKG